MPYREFHYRWEWQLQNTPEALWSLVADTNRFDRDAKLPAVTIGNDEKTPSVNARRRLHYTQLGMKVEWDEEPFEWIRPFRYSVVRNYLSGPVSDMRLVTEMFPLPEGGTRLVQDIWARPKSPLGVIAIPLEVGVITARRFADVYRRYDELASRGQTPAEQPNPTQFPDSGRARLAAMGDKLRTEGASPELVKRLITTIEEADDLTLMRLRPYALADCWKASRRDVLELCLLATRHGLLDFRWEMLCPLCRGAKQVSGTLADIPSEIHCDVCHIDSRVNFDRSVELTFRPNPSVREIEVNEFCVGGPQVTPHIVMQQLLKPEAQRSLPLTLEEGRYRVRTLLIPGGQSLMVKQGGAPALTLRATGEGWSNDELDMHTTTTLNIENATDDEQLFILERMIWTDQAATAAEATALQLFRDLFANEALRPNQQISVGQMTILFTDLRGSTRLYREIGDAPAFGAVMNHFDVLRDAVAEEEGAMVKTLGDAVMAVFRHPASAIRAMLKAQKALAAPPEGGRPLLLKAGMHTGPCIAVTLNGRLDYFGSNVNIAARLEPLSTGCDIVISTAVRDDPRVETMLADPDNHLRIEPLEAKLKGFDDEHIALWRITVDDRNAAT
ncbi:MAG: adenylate/guanylate cyclase domain-containing protein [Pyrinomonadaceae bacterium MAG19_C2-C3]|nr:adenylate/guanylate cyclase domain-containing protein [Pyrinomonadaceae bacterium MAG19_C2-C3]